MTSAHGRFTEITAMSYNIQIGIASAHNPTWDPQKINLDAIVEIIRNENPHIVALQEVDRFRKRSGMTDQAAYLAERLGMQFAYAPSVYDVETEMGRGMYGNALLSKFPIDRYYVHRLRGRTHLLPDEPEWVIEPRTVLEARLIVNGRPLYAYALHLSTTADQQVVQVEDLRRLLRQVSGPQIVMGDFNAKPDAPHMEKLLAEFHSPLEQVTPRATYPNGLEAEVAIDYILLSGEIGVKEAYVVQEMTGASDHNPVVARLRLPM